MENEFVLTNSEYIESPNFDDRPIGVTVDTIIIHCISLPEMHYDNDHVTSLFLNILDHESHASFRELENTKVSSHLLIKRNGKIIQYVPFNKRAWHAGKSDYAGRSNYNDFSIGIELHGSISDNYTDDQYRALQNTIKHLKQMFPSIKDNNILGHSDIAPDRKVDPGPKFIWGKIK